MKNENIGQSGCRNDEIEMKKVDMAAQKLAILLYEPLDIKIQRICLLILSICLTTTIIFCFFVKG